MLSNFQCIRRRLDTILGRFGINLGGSETLALERARARSTFDEIDFFRLGDRLGLDFVTPDALLGSSLAFSERSLGSLGRSCGAPGGPERALGGSWGDFWGSRGRLLGRSLALLGSLGPPMAPRTHQNAFARARSSENAAKRFLLEPAQSRGAPGGPKP